MQDPSCSPAPALSTVAEMVTDHRGNSQKAVTPPQAQPLRAGLHTPPRGRSAGLPDEPISPGPGSGTEEIRQWAVKMFVSLNDKVNKLSHDMLGQVNRIDRITIGKDTVEIADRVKHLEQQMVVKPGYVKEINELQEGLRNSTRKHLDIDERLRIFEERVQASAAHITNVENLHQQHVNENFAAVERGFQDLRTTAAAWTASSTSSATTGSTQATGVNMDHQLMKIKLEAQETLVGKLVAQVKAASDGLSGTTKSQEQIRTMMEQFRYELEIIKAEQSGGGSGTNGGTNGGGNGGGCKGPCGGGDNQQTTSSGQPCHCWHVDDLLRRVRDIEAAISSLAKSGQVHATAATAPTGQASGADPWGGWSAGWSAPVGAPPGVDGGHGAGGGGGGGGRGSGSGYHGGGGDDGHYDAGHGQGRGGEERIIYSKLFDDKVAQSQEFQFSGGEGSLAEKWRKTVRGYWISKCPGLLPILDWAEAAEERPITNAEIDQNLRNYVWMTELNVYRLSELIWGFLNMCLKGEAKDIFDGAGILDGLNAWRLVVSDIHKSRWVRLSQLRRAVRNVQPIKNLDEVSTAIVRFEANIKNYVEALGAEGERKKPDDLEMKEDLLEALPLEIRESIQWRASGPQSYVEFRNHVRATTNQILYQRGKFKGPLNAVDGQPGQGQGPEPSGADDDFPNLSNEVMAVLKRFGVNMQRRGQQDQGGRRDQAPPRPGGPGGPGGPRHCINCGKTTHATKDCPEANVPREKRPCWNCLKPGHTSADCPLKKDNKGSQNGRAAALVDQQPGDDADRHIGMVVHGFEQPRRTAKPRPTPRDITMADFVGNRFDALRETRVERVSSSSLGSKSQLSNRKFIRNSELQSINSKLDVGKILAQQPSAAGEDASPPAPTPPGSISGSPEAEAGETTPYGPPGDVEPPPQPSSTWRTRRPRPSNPSPPKIRFADEFQNAKQSQCSDGCGCDGHDDLDYKDLPGMASSSDEEEGNLDNRINDQQDDDGDESDGDGGGETLTEFIDKLPHGLSNDTLIKVSESKSQRVNDGHEDVETGHVQDLDGIHGIKVHNDDISDNVEGTSAVQDKSDNVKDIYDVQDESEIFKHNTDKPVGTMPQPQRDPSNDDNQVATLEYNVDNDHALLATEDVVEIAPAADSGAVDHVASPKDIPGSTMVAVTDETRDFLSANNGVIKNHGEALVDLEQEDGPTVSSSFQVADVSRPLHSVSKICDNDKEMLFMKDQAVIVPAGTFSRLLASVKPLVRYKRSGGLYVAKMKARSRPASSFTRPGPGR